MFSRHVTSCVATHTVDPADTDGAFILLYDGTIDVAMSDEPQLHAVWLVSSNGSTAHTGHYFLDVKPESDSCWGQQHVVASVRQVLPLTGVADLQPGHHIEVADAALNASL